MRAIAIDDTSKLEARSWDLPDTRREPFVGYAAPEAKVLAFMDDEENHLEAVLQFPIKREIERRPAGKPRGERRRVYNGAGYAKNAYDAKTAAAFARWSKVSYTTLSPDPQAPMALPPDIEPPLIIEPKAA